MKNGISFRRTQQGKDVFTEYKATAFINPLKTHHTGKYLCSSTEYEDVFSYFYVYVPGKCSLGNIDRYYSPCRF